MYTKAIVRRPGRNFASGITTSNLGKPDFNKALEQHAAYCNALIRCGVELTVLEADERFPDGCFVEDTAVVTSGVAVISRPGADTRRGEEEEIARVLAGFGHIESITAPGTLEGGDVLRADNHYFIGISERTNKEGASQLSAILSKYGFTSSFIRVEAGLHLKSDIVRSPYDLMAALQFCTITFPFGSSGSTPKGFVVLMNFESRRPKMPSDPG